METLSWQRGPRGGVFALLFGVQSSQLQHDGQLVIEDPVNGGHCQRDAVTQVQLRRAVQRRHLASYVLHGLKI